MHVLDGLVAFRGVGWLGQQVPPWGQQAPGIVVHGCIVQADDKPLSALEPSLHLLGLQHPDKLLEDVIEFCCGDVACVLWWVSW